MTKSNSSLDPALRRRLLQELRSPWRGLRRTLWFALTASGAVGIAVMALRASAGVDVPAVDFGIQLLALLFYAGLLWLDRDRRGGVP